MNEFFSKLAEFKNNMPSGVKIKIELFATESPCKPEKPGTGTENVMAKVDRLLESVDNSNEAIQFYSHEWVTAADAARFHGCVSTVKRAAKMGQVVWRIKPNDGRNTLQVCPKSYTLFLNEVRDPRLD